jgi:hypothetical protein
MQRLFIVKLVVKSKLVFEDETEQNNLLLITDFM